MVVVDYKVHLTILNRGLGVSDMGLKYLLFWQKQLFASCALQGGREVADFVEFIKKKATNPPVLPAEEKKSKKKKSGDDKEEL